MTPAGLLLERLRAGARAFRRDRRGVSALEFALLAPLLIMLYFGATELAQGMMAQRRVSHAAATIGDLVSQDKIATSVSELTNVFAAAAAVVSPFSSAPLKLRLTSVTGDAVNGTPRVDWSQAQGGLVPLVKNATVTLPAGLVSASGDNVIMAEAQYKYTPAAPLFLGQGLTFNEIFYVHPRLLAKVPCSDCP